MSIKVMSWVWDQHLASTTKLVLLALADHADDEGTCWPGINGVAAKCGVSDRTVQRVLQKAQDDGLLTVGRRYDRDGRQRSSYYRLLMGVTTRQGEGDTVSPPGDSMSGEGDIGVTPEGDTVSPLESSEESSKESSSSCATARMNQAEDDKRFAQDEIDEHFVVRIVHACTSKQVRNLDGYISTALQRAGLFPADSTVKRYVTAVQQRLPDERRRSWQRYDYPARLLEAAKRAGVEPAGRAPNVVATEIKSMGYEC